MRNLLIMGLIFIVMFFVLEMAIAESPEEKRRIEEEKRKALDETELKILKEEARITFDYGGWANYRYDEYKDDDNSSAARDTLDYSFSLDTRFWMKIAYSPDASAQDAKEHSLYLRLKDLNIWRRPQDLNRAYDNNGPHVDYAYSVLDFRPAWLEIGRRYFSVGQGIAYSNVNDGLELLASWQKLSLKAFLSRSLPHEDNIDTSAPGFSKKSERHFYGIEGTYLGISNHGIYSYIAVQRDNSDEEPVDFLHDYTYDSEYFGLGAQGKITRNIHYWSEIIRETGESRIFTTGENKKVDAWAGDFGISYDLEFYSHPNFSIEYAFGSGDADRISVTDTQDGNISGDDKNFLYFGYLPTGYALTPRLSNLHFYKTGILLKPLEKYGSFRNLSLGIDYYRYYKDKRSSGIYDSEASLSDRDIGSEIDLSLSWQIFSDLTWSLEYGHFNPGDAYPDSTPDPEDYFSISMTYAF